MFFCTKNYIEEQTCAYLSRLEEILLGSCSFPKDEKNTL